MEDSQEEYFEISAVAQLTGISPQLLRMWERRYQVVEPDRSDSKRRRYTKFDVQKLTKLKNLVDNGHAIGSIASLTLEQIEERHHEVFDQKSESSDISIDQLEIRIAVVGETLATLLSEIHSDASGIRTIGHFVDLGEMKQLLKKGAADVLMLEKETLFDDDVAELRELMTGLMIPHILVVYQFAQSDAVALLKSEDMSALKFPVGREELQFACIQSAKSKKRKNNGDVVSGGADRNKEITRPVLGDIPEKQFSYTELVKIGKMSSVVGCECPQHLARLISSLSAFESYSRGCEDRNDDDAKLHAYLHQSTADCRAKMENALIEVLHQEKIEV